MGRSYCIFHSSIPNTVLLPILFIWAAHFLDAFSSPPLCISAIVFMGKCELAVQVLDSHQVDGNPRSTPTQIFMILWWHQNCSVLHMTFHRSLYIFLHRDIFYGMPLMTTPTRGQSVNCSSIMTYHFHRCGGES